MPWEPPEGGSIILDEIVDNSRWSIAHRLVVKFPGDPEDVAWETSYSHGATEMQDESPWEYENEVTFDRVRLVEKTIKVWERD